MQRLHVNLGVDNLDASVEFYTTLFGAAPSVLKDDYAKWMLDDPRVNFSLDATGCGAGKGGVNHLGIQVENDRDLAAVSERLQRAGHEIRGQNQVTCCYHKQNKTWVTDPQGVDWETFHTYGESTEYGGSR